MSERKPPGVTWETWIDRQIREGMQRGDFDDLPGHGRPLRDLDGPRDDLWWVRDKLRREGASYLPPTVAIRKDAEDAEAAIAAADSEEVVRRVLAEVNARIRAVNRTVTAGPPSTVAPFDVERTVAAWRRARS
jgi:hypothetical protein